MSSFDRTLKTMRPDNQFYTRDNRRISMPNAEVPRDGIVVRSGRHVRYGTDNTVHRVRHPANAGTQSNPNTEAEQCLCNKTERGYGVAA
jgi:hypothetical protein